MKKKVLSLCMAMAMAAGCIAQVQAQSADTIKKKIEIPPIQVSVSDEVQWREDDGAFIISQVLPTDVEANQYRQDTAYILPLDDTTSIEIRNELENMSESEIEDALDIISGREAVSTLSTGGSNYKYAWDESVSVKLYTTVSYELTTVSGTEYIGITEVTGGYYSSTGSGSNLGNGVYVQKHYMNVKQSGTTPTKNYANQAKNGYTFILGNRTWTYFPSSSWEPVRTNGMRTVGVTYYADLKRAGSYWTASVQNTVSYE